MAGHRAHLVTGLDQGGHQPGSDETGCAGDEHEMAMMFLPPRLVGRMPFASCIGQTSSSIGVRSDDEWPSLAGTSENQR